MNGSKYVGGTKDEQEKQKRDSLLNICWHSTPPFHEGMRRFGISSPRRFVFPCGRVLPQYLPPVMGASLCLLHPAEPVEIVLEPPGRDAVEPREEGAEPRVKRVHEGESVALGLRVVPSVLEHAQGRESPWIGPMPVGRDDGAFGYPAVEHRLHLARRRTSSAAELGEAVAAVVGAGDDADEFVRDAGRLVRPAVTASTPGHHERRPVLIPFEHFTQHHILTLP
jgi:hypothetical protein